MEFRIDSRLACQIADSPPSLGHFAGWPRTWVVDTGGAHKTHLLIVTIDSRVVSARYDLEGSPDPIKAQLFREVLA
jgi:hypothetical protein